MQQFVQSVAGNYGSQQGRGQQPPPLPPPWVSRWDEASQRPIYINERTGERTFQHPQPGYGSQAGYPGQGQHQPPPSNNHNLADGAVGVAAGLVGGALLMHEGEKLRMQALSFSHVPVS